MTKKLSTGLLKIVLVLLTFDSLFICCKKYSGDPRHYLFKSPVNRLGRVSAWDLKQYHINGADSIKSLMKRYSSVNFLLSQSNWLNFTVSGKHKTSVDFNSDIGTVTMTLVNNKNNLNISITSLKSGYYNPFIHTSTDWKIEELTGESTGNVLKLSSTIDGINYVLVFNG